ncbi:MAG: hypothetical protein IT340_18450 [Chloroflexi bacterium]|nr:hypothetical protein [Chloroflexota bacterium]
MVRPAPLTLWSSGLLLLVLLVAATQPADADGGPRRILTPMTPLVAAIAPAEDGGPPPGLPPETTVIARLPAAEAALATPVTRSVIVPPATVSAPDGGAGPPPPPLLATGPAPAPVFRRWTFADGWTGPGFDEALIVSNPTHQPARLRVTYERPDQPPLVRDLTVAARGRRTITVTDEVDGVGRNGGRGWSVTTHVASLDTDDLTVERVLRLHYRVRRTAPPPG